MVLHTQGLFATLSSEMRLRGYSHKTFKAYKSWLRNLTSYFSPRHPRELTNDDIRNYLLHLIDEKKLAASTVNQAFNAIRFLYVELYKKSFVIDAIPRPQKEHKLPVVLSLEEVKKIFDAFINLKHRTILMLIYSAGLRVGEAVKLKPENIDSARGMIHVRAGKGKKDRYTILSDGVLEGLRTYWKMYKPSKWLFEGQEAGKPLSVRSVQKVFERAIVKAQIRKKVSVHSLRHAFATHLLEGGTDLRFIQELLGHASSKTTEIYTHVTTRSIQKIRSPIEQIMPTKAKENLKTG